MTWLSDTLTALSACLASELTKPTCWHGVWSGEEVPWDYCGECSGDSCGMAAVRLRRAFPSTEFPQPALTATCRTPMAYEVVMTVLRCLPPPESDGSLPPPADFAASNVQVAEDVNAMIRAIQCCLDDDAIEHVMGEYTPAGPAGQCVGGTLAVTIARG